jgi:uncharacterized membrane protein YkoI
MGAFAEMPLIVCLCFALVLGWTEAFPAMAEEPRSIERNDQDIVREALERGESLPLETVLASVRRAFAGEIVGVEIERNKLGWVYEIKVIAPNGAIQKIEVDPKTGRMRLERGK